MARVYADLLERNLKNYNDDILNSKSSATRKLAPQIKAIVEADGYVINPDGTVTKKPIIPVDAE